MVGEKFASAWAGMAMVGMAASATIGCERLIDARWDEYTTIVEGTGGGGGTGGSTSSARAHGGGGSGIGGSGAGGAGGAGVGGAAGGGLPAVPVTWPDSLTTRCSDGRTVLEECPEPSEPFFGQDGNYQIAVPSYTERDGTVTDSVTGLVWEKVTESEYFTVANAPEHCATLAAELLGGLATWRLPTRRELVSILDFGHSTAFQDIFTIHQDSFYWSSTDTAADTSSVWAVNATNGSVYFVTKTSVRRAICVAGERGMAQPDLSFGEDWVLDRSTGLVWQRFPSTSFAWSDALSHCEELTLAGKSDWRLPNAKELLSIVDDRRSDPAIDLEAFPGAPISGFWSSTPAINNAERAVLVSFSNGTSEDHAIRDQRIARCVRSDE